MKLKLGDYILGDIHEDMALMIIEALAGKKNLVVEGSIHRTFTGPMYDDVHQLDVEIRIGTLIHAGDDRE